MLLWNAGVGNTLQLRTVPTRPNQDQAGFRRSIAVARATIARAEAAVVAALRLDSSEEDKEGSQS